jgi:hypothetical protein
MPVGWGCSGGWHDCRDWCLDRGEVWPVLVVGYRSRRAVTARVAGCGGRAAASASESDRGCSGRRRSSGCVVASRRRCSTARYVVASGSAWPLRRVRGRSDDGLRVRRTLETGCVGVQWWRERGGCQRVRGGCQRVRGGCQRVRGGTRLRSTWSGNGGVCG